jgi:hypothetical protein
MRSGEVDLVFLVEAEQEKSEAEKSQFIQFAHFPYNFSQLTQSRTEK